MSIERMKGRDLVAYADEGGYTMVAMATDSDLAIDADMKETTNPLSGRAKCYKMGRYSWMLNVARLYMVDDNPYNSGEDSSVKETNWLQEGTVVCVGLATRSELFNPEEGTFAHVKRYYGQAIVKSVRVNAPVNGLANYRVVFQGTGELNAEPNRWRHVIPPRP